jgi:tyrosyl-tRNA synthetase
VLSCLKGGGVGFEPLTCQGIQKAINVNKLTKAGCKFIFWVADWFALLNNKLDGDLKKIQTVGRYMVEVWKASGMDMANVEFRWSSDEINKHANEYWLRVMDIARKNSLTRLKRCAQIMGRAESDDMPGAQILYPCMQCADIFFLRADICQLGLDQRKVNVLAREYSAQIKLPHPPIIVSHSTPPHTHPNVRRDACGAERGAGEDVQERP